jgi:hypothetical protein
MRRALAALAMLFLVAGAAPAQPVQPQPAPAAAGAGAYHHFRAAIYLTVSDTRRLADRAAFEREFGRVSSQLRFDKVYIEAYRDHVFATDEELDRSRPGSASAASRPRAGSPSPPAAKAASSARSTMRMRPTAPNASARCASSPAISTR